MISVVFNLVPLSSWTDYLPTVDSFQVDRYPLDKEQAYFGHRRNVARLHAQLRSLFPALEQSYEHPSFTVRHNHEGITRSFLTDSVADLTTLPLEDREHYYLIVSNNSGVFSDIAIRMKLPQLQGTAARPAHVLNEEWSRTVAYSEEAGEWILDPHTMCFGDVNIWVIPKVPPAE